MTEPLLTIGAFARAVGLSASALRHYDECGVLRPAEVDDETGYRYYTPDLERRARLVVRLREAGVPIATMRQVLEGPPEDAVAVLARFRTEQSAAAARRAELVQEVIAEVSEPRTPETPARLSVRGPELAGALRQVLPAADHDTASPLASVLLELTAGELDVVATNRWWMAVRTLAGPASSAGRVVLARADASRLADRLDDAGEVSIELADTTLTVGDTRVAGLHTPYPAHRIVLAGVGDATTRAVLSRSELVESLEQTGRSTVRLELDQHGARVGPAGETGGQVAADVGGTVTGEPVTVRIRSAIVLRLLAAALGPRVEIELAGPDRPLRVRSPYQPGFLGLAMAQGD